MARVAPKKRGDKIVTQAGTPKSRDNRMLVIGSVIGVVLLGLVALFLLTRGGSADPSFYADIEQSGTMVGDPNAPVTVQEYVDFRCSHCRDAAQTVLPTIIDDYVRDGQVRIEYLPVGLLGQESVISAQAALCAAQQNQYAEYQEQAFANFNRTSNIDNLTSYANTVGMDGNAFRTCLTSGQTTEQVNTNTQALIEGGNPSTPTFVVNGTERVVGADLNGLRSAIEAELAAAE